MTGASRVERAVAWALGGVILLLAAYRAVVLPFSHDEAVTYLAGVAPGFRSWLAFEFCSANNHFLNTLAMLLAGRIAGTAEWVLRLPNLLAAVAYMTAAWCLASRLRSGPLHLLAFTALVANLAVMDYWSMARGYGLALACLLLAMLWVDGSVRRSGLRDGWADAALVVLAVGTVAHLMLLYTFAALWCAVAWSRLKAQAGVAPGWPARLQGLERPLWIGMALAALVGPQIARMQMRGQLYYGNHDGFFAGTLSSLAGLLLNAASGRSVSLLAGAMVLLWAMAGGVVLFRRKAMDVHLAPGRLVLLVLSVAAACPIAAFHLAGVPLPQGRTALNLLPLGIWLLLLVADAWACRRPAFSAALARLAVLGLLVLFALRIDLRAFQGLSFDADTKRMMADLQGEVERSGRTDVVRLGVDWRLEPAVNFYRETRSLAWLAEADRSGHLGDHMFYEGNRAWYDPHGNRPPRDDHDYVYADERSLEQEEVRRSYRVVKRYPVSGFALAVRGASDEAEGRER